MLDIQQTYGRGGISNRGSQRFLENQTADGTPVALSSARMAERFYWFPVYFLRRREPNAQETMRHANVAHALTQSAYSGSFRVGGGVCHECANTGMDQSHPFVCFGKAKEEAPNRMDSKEQGKQARREMGTWALPPEVTVLVFECTPKATRSLLRCVSVEWHSLLQRNPVFDHKHKSTAARNGRCYCMSRRACAIRYALSIVHQRHWRVLDWMIGLTGAFDGINAVDKKACETAAADGDLERLLAFGARGYRIGASVGHNAAQHGHRHILELPFVARMIEDDERISAFAAKGGHLTLLRWLHQKGYPLCSSLTSRAAAGGHLDVIKWATEHGCLWSAHVCMSATRNNRRDIIEWTTAHGCPRDGCLVTVAAKAGNLQLLQWLHGDGYRLTINACVGAAEAGHLAVL